MLDDPHLTTWVGALPWIGMIRRGGGTSALADGPAESPAALAERRLEARLRLLAPPIAFLLAFALMASPAGRGVARVFLTMWVHELGHAVTAWLSGFGAFPGPWRTPVSDARIPLLALALAVALGVALVRAWRAERRALAGALAAVLVVQLVLTLGVSAATARVLFTFGGEAGMLVLGALGAASFFVPTGHHLHTSWLRWGFLVIGAAAFADATTTWWAARSDLEAIPFGEIEGVGLSDASKLVDVHRWSVQELVGRHLAVAAVSGVALTAVWLFAAWRARRPEA